MHVTKQDALSKYIRTPLFAGFPYIVTKIAAAMHHFIVLPAGHPSSGLERLTRVQWRANRLPTCLVLAADRALYFSEGGANWAEFAPRCEIPICDRLMPAEDFRLTEELTARQQRLREFVRAGPTSGYLVDRAQTANDRRRLSGVRPDGVPRRLRRCTACRGWRGQALLSGSDLVVEVSCSCQNHNRCARCMGQLSERRIDACAYFEDEGKVLHVPAFTAFQHKCAKVADSGAN